MTRIIKTTESELEAVVARALKSQLLELGIVAHDNDAVIDRQKDFAFLHEFRKTTESTKSRVGAAFLVLATGGILAMLVSGFKIWTRQP